MKIEVSSYIQEWLITIALVIIIPTAVYLGVVLLAPQIQINQYYEARKKFFKDYSRKHAEEYHQREDEWAKTKVFSDYNANMCERKGLMLIVSGTISCLLFFLGATFVLPIISCGLMVAGLNVIFLNFFMYAPCWTYHGIKHNFIEMCFYLIGLLIVLWFAYQSSEKNNVTNSRK